MEKSLFQLPIKVLKQYSRYRNWQFRSKKELGRFQDKKLKDLIRHSYNHVTYYRQLFSDAGLDPDKFRGRVDLHKIPLLDKEYWSFASST